jgi:diguanylate cyclase (GGDEF)-like protein
MVPRLDPRAAEGLGGWVVHAEKLSRVLSDFARTMATDFPIQAILDHLVARIVEILPITSAGVTLISAGQAPHYVAASDDAALKFERLQSSLGEGPCLAAYASGRAVSIADLRSDVQFPTFSPAALEAGLAAVFTFPMREGGGRLGALDLYRDAIGGLDVDDMQAAQTLADVAAAYVLNAQARDEVQASAARYRHSALHDALTGLPNRLLLEQRLEHAARRSHRSRTNAAILFVDLDRFKHVNDTHGHGVGDQLLIAVGQRLTRLVRPGDTLARFAGDEFVFLCEDMQAEVDVEHLADRVDAAFSEPFVLEGTELILTASVGVAFTGPGESISDQLLAEADMAMYQAKRKGGDSHQIIDLREALRTLDQNSLAADLRVAFAHDNLEIAYQPVVRSADGVVTGVEALVRWTDPVRGPVPSTILVAIAEQSDLINDIGSWVLQRACHDRGDWLRQYPHAPLELSVNVSARQLMSDGFCESVADIVTTVGMDPTALVLEMTEHILIDDNERTTTVLTDLRKRGIRVALDDFGTGYSSLSYLRRLPIDILKIDRAFIADIGRAPAGRAIASAVTNLAHVLGLAVTAEGIETEEQREAVAAMGCDYAQGYLYARPMSADAIAAHLGGRPDGPPRLP